MGIKYDSFVTVYRNETKLQNFQWETADLDWWRDSIAEHFMTFIPAMGILYLAGIYYGKKWMENRPPFEFNKILILWNSGLAIFSAVVFYKGFDDFLDHLAAYGFHSSACVRLPISKTAAFWSVTFLISKIFELGDTAFLVLRKKPVIFLHWFHHFTVLLTGFYIYPRFEPIPLFSGLVNALVHAFMYTYFALMAAGYKIPKKIAMSITAIQILQFIAVLAGTFYALVTKYVGGSCAFSYETINYYVTLGSIYLTLFAQIFYQNYKSLQMQKSKSN